MVVISDGEDTNSARIQAAIQEGFRKAGQNINTLDNKTLYQMTVANRNQAAAAERTRVSKSLQDADTVFYSINPAGSSYQLNQMSVFGQENMQKFASETGGTAFLPKFAPIDTKDALQNSSNIRKNQQALDNIFRQLASELRAQYLVQYYSDSEYPLGRFVKLDVGLKNPAGRHIRARQGYYVKWSFVAGSRFSGPSATARSGKAGTSSDSSSSRILAKLGRRFPLLARPKI